MIPVLITLIYFIPLAVILFFFISRRSKFKNRSWSGAFFFENDCLVLNTGIPYDIPFDEIESVELQYSSWELEHKWSYGMWVKVVRKNGKTKRVFYKGYRTAQLALPSDMKAALEEKGLLVLMNDRDKKEKG